MPRYIYTLIFISPEYISFHHWSLWEKICSYPRVVAPVKHDRPALLTISEVLRIFQVYSVFINGRRISTTLFKLFKGIVLGLASEPALSSSKPQSWRDAPYRNITRTEILRVAKGSNLSRNRPTAHAICVGRLSIACKLIIAPGSSQKRLNPPGRDGLLTIRHDN